MKINWIRKISWIRVWDNFEKWMIEREDSGYCSKCGHLTDYPEWEEQQKKIQQLVSRQLRS